MIHEGEKDNLGNLTLLVEAVGVIAFTTFCFRVIVLEEDDLFVS